MYVSVIAGNGANTRAEDPLPTTNVATNIPMLQPRAVEVDASGNVYIADTGHGRIVQRNLLEFDFLTNYAWQREGSFQNYIPRTVIGIGRNVEVGANVSYTHVSGESLPIEIQPNIKWQVYSNESNGTAIAVGCIVYAPLTHRAEARTIGQCYSVASKQLRGRFGPRFTGGAYALVHANEQERTKAGAIVGYQQPLSKKISPGTPIQFCATLHGSGAGRNSSTMSSDDCATVLT